MPGIEQIRFIGPVMGRYVLASRRLRKDDSLQVFACRLQSISPHFFVANAPLLGQPGEALTARFEPFGLLRGRIDRLVAGGFAVSISADDAERGRLAGRIAWYKRRTFAGIADKRTHKRLMPRRPGSRLLFGDGSEMPCLIIDMSSSGAALSADIRPPLGYPLAVGKVVGKVVRYLEVGFAVQFLEERAVEDLERLLGVGDEAMAEYFSGEWTTGAEGADNLPETASEQDECTQSDAMPATGT